MVKTRQYYSDLTKEWEEGKAPWIKLYKLSQEYIKQWEDLHKDICLCNTIKRFDTFEEALDFVKKAEYILATGIGKWIVDEHHTGQYVIFFKS